MRRSVVLCASVCLASPALAQTQILICEGWAFYPVAHQVAHIVAIDKTKAMATVDEERYGFTETATQIVLSGTSKLTMTIDRTTGSYFITGPRPAGDRTVLPTDHGRDITDWSRPSDRGCTLAPQKF